MQSDLDLTLIVDEAAFRRKGQYNTDLDMLNVIKNKLNDIKRK